MKIRSFFKENFDKTAADQLEKYFELVLEGNKTQNLTRITDPEGFFNKNIQDGVELVKTGFLEDTQADLGTGAGIPGIVCAILDPAKNWILIDSEKRKADFLSRTIESLGLKNATVSNKRAEEILDTIKTKTIVSRAVGTVETIYKTIRKCSTWNKLILLKGPTWPDEWEKFSKKKNLALGLDIHSTHNYSQRVIICLKRVPRGT